MKYKTIYADPPWMEHGGGKISRGADRHYPLMKTKDTESVIERNQRIGTGEKIAYFKVKQQLPYECKVQYAELRAREFESECAARGLNTHVSVGGLDSITLLLFLRSIATTGTAGCRRKAEKR